MDTNKKSVDYVIIFRTLKQIRTYIVSGGANVLDFIEKAFNNKRYEISFFSMSQESEKDFLTYVLFPEKCTGGVLIGNLGVGISLGKKPLSIYVNKKEYRREISKRNIKR